MSRSQRPTSAAQRSSGLATADDHGRIEGELKEQQYRRRSSTDRRSRPGWSTAANGPAVERAHRDIERLMSTLSSTLTRILRATRSQDRTVLCTVAIPLEHLHAESFVDETGLLEG